MSRKPYTKEIWISLSESEPWIVDFWEGKPPRKYGRDFGRSWGETGRLPDDRMVTWIVNALLKKPIKIGERRKLSKSLF